MERRRCIAELIYSFDIEIIQNRYYINNDSVKFPHKFTMDIKTYVLNIEDIYSGETLIISANN